jgi:hypothetical protein
MVILTVILILELHQKDINLPFNIIVTCMVLPGVELHGEALPSQHVFPKLFLKIPFYYIVKIKISPLNFFFFFLILPLILNANFAPVVALA